MSVRELPVVGDSTLRAPAAFGRKLAEHGLELRSAGVETLQINVGRKCNQACRHCHVDAAPWRTEMIDAETAHRVGKWIETNRPEVVDITGGAPELSEFFPYLVETARALYEELRRTMPVEYDASAAIGKRYRRQDEIGTPWALTVDQQTQEDGTVTLRDRDSLQQERVPVEGVPALLRDRLDARWDPR